MIRTTKKRSRSSSLQDFRKAEMLQNIRRHADCTPTVIHHLEQIPDEILQNVASPEARRFNKMIKQVFREMERVRQFTRTKLNNHGILYATVEYSHTIEDLIIEYFHNRFPRCWICLYNRKSKMCLVWKGHGKGKYVPTDLDSMVKQLNQEHPIQPYFEDIQVETEDLFNSFYSSQYIASRKNPRYYRQMIPLSVRKLPGLQGKIETSLENKSLDVFIKKSKKIDK